MKNALAAAETLAAHLNQRGMNATVQDVPKNEWMSKVAMPIGNVCVYSNKKGVIRHELHELAADHRDRVQAAIDDLKAIQPLSPTSQPALQAGQGGSESPQAGEAGHLIAFTDGSDQNSQCGWSAVICDPTRSNPDSRVAETSGNLGPQPNKQIAGEVEGAVQAIDYAIRHNAKSLVIRHDYEGVGQWAGRKWKANDPDAKRIQVWTDYAKQKGLELKFVWVRAHNGNPGNERADELAGKATRLPVTPRIPTPKVALREPALPGMDM